jgi:exonuclease III
LGDDCKAYINDVLSENDIDIMCIQETWLPKSNTGELDKITDSYMSIGVSGIPDTVVLRGRPYGGTGILWKDSMSHMVKPVDTGCDMLCSIKVTFSDESKVLLVNCYMPVDNYKQHEVDAKFQVAVDHIERILIENSEVSSVLICGDLNIDLSRNNSHAKCMWDFNERNQLVFSKLHTNAKYLYTYSDIRNNKQIRSTIDQFIVSDNLFGSIMSVVNVGEQAANHGISALSNDILNPSKHSVLKMVIKRPINYVKIEKPRLESNHIAWHKVTDKHKGKYADSITDLLSVIELPEAVINCHDVLCTDAEHKEQIEVYCIQLIDICLKAGEKSFPQVKSRYSKVIPGWKDNIQPMLEAALLKSWEYKQNGSPKEGPLLEEMRKARHDYHYAIKHAKRNENNIRKAKMAKCVAKNNNRDFWKEHEKVNRDKRKRPPHVDNKTQNEDINNVFAKKYNTLYSSNPSDEKIIKELNDNLRKDLENYNGKQHVIKVEQVSKAITKLKKDKSDGSKGLHSNHLIYAPYILNIHIALLLTAMHIHGYTPGDMLNGTILSILKDKLGNKCDSENYSGICLCSVISKLYEWIMVDEHRNILQTSNLQFSFKKKHSTVMCSMTLKETVKYYHNRGSKVFACFIDASKAFDRLRHDRLFELLRQRGLPPIVLCLIMDMYRRQSSRTVWDDCYSDYFGARNGVRQGGVASPILFTIYMDELLLRLERTKVGCYIGHEWYGSVGYADDVELQCPSIKGLQILVDTCSEFGEDYGVLYNSKKSMCMVFSIGKQTDLSTMPKIYLNGKALSWVNKVKHLGIYLTSDLSEDEDIRHKQSDFIGRVNSLMYTYGFATSDVLTILLDSKCSHFYGCESWDLSQSSVINRIATTWNKAMSKVWALPPDSHRSILTGLNLHSKHALDKIYAKSVKMIISMIESENSKVSFLVTNSFNDKRSIMQKNFNFVQKAWKTNKDIKYVCTNVNRYSIYNEIDKPLVQAIRDFKGLAEGEMFIENFHPEEANELINFLSTI